MLKRPAAAKAAANMGKPGPAVHKIAHLAAMASVMQEKTVVAAALIAAAAAVSWPAHPLF